MTISQAIRWGVCVVVVALAVLCSQSLCAQSLAPLWSPASATHTAVQDGSWSTPGTWNTGTVPPTGSKVYIPLWRAITVFTCSTEAPFWIKVDGLLRFATDRSTCLDYESLFIGHTGK